jgi:hypothetical protein
MNPRTPSIIPRTWPASYFVYSPCAAALRTAAQAWTDYRITAFVRKTCRFSPELRSWPKAGFACKI